MAQINTGYSRPFVAGADLSSSQYCIAKVGSTQNQVIVATASTDKIVGVITGFATTGKTGDGVTIQKGGFSTLISMSASCNVGDLITATTSGQGVVTTTNKDFIVGRALQAAVNANDIVEVELLMCFLSAT